MRIRRSFLRSSIPEVDDLRVLLMHNPTAGDEDHDSRSLSATLEAAGHEVAWKSMKDSDWELALDERADLVVAAGGDGTVGKVFRQLAGRSVPVTIFPVGTANNIARSLGFEYDDPAQLIRGWADGRTQPCDIGSLSSPIGEERFVESAGGGLFANVLRRAENDEHKNPGEDKIEEGLHMLRENIARARALPWRLRLDGEDVFDDLVALEVMNMREAGPRIPLAPQADAGDGLLEVVSLRAEDAEVLATYVEARLDGRPADEPRFEVRRAHEVVLQPPPGCPLHFDDELLSRGPSEGAENAIVRLAAQVEVLVPGPGGTSPSQAGSL
jgi:diacylglycerol kinase (ATP)